MFWFHRSHRARPTPRVSHRRLIIEPLERREMLTVSLGDEIESEAPVPTIGDPLDVTPPQVSFGLPAAVGGGRDGVRVDGLRPERSCGGVPFPLSTSTDGTSPTFWGTAEVGAIVQLFDDIDRNGLVDAGEPLLGETVAMRTDDSDAGGYWEITSVLDLNDLTSLWRENRTRRVLVQAIDAVGNVNHAEFGEQDQGLTIHLYTPAPWVPAALPDGAVDETPPPVSFGLPGVWDGLRTHGSRGVVTCPTNKFYNYTNDTHPTFWGLAEVGAIVQLFADLNGDGLLDDDGHLLGETVAVRTDSSDPFASGFWEITSAVDLNDLTIFRQRDGSRDVRVRAIDAAGNVNDLNVEFEIFLDTRTPVSFGLPDVSGDGLRTDSDSGDDTFPPTLDTSDTRPTFWGLAEVGETVQLFADINGNGQRDAGEPLLGGTVAVPNDDNDGSASGIWEITSVLDLNDLYDLSIFKERDGARDVLVLAQYENGHHDPTRDEWDQELELSLQDVIVAPDDGVDTLPDDPADRTPPPVSFGLAGVRGDGLRTDDSSGVVTIPPTSDDRLTNDTSPTFWGLAEVGAIVQLFADINGNGQVDAGEPLLGETVAAATDDSRAFALGFWEITSAVDLNDLTIFEKRDGPRNVIARAIDVAGNVNDPMSGKWNQELEILLVTPPPVSFGVPWTSGDGLRTDGTCGGRPLPAGLGTNNTSPTFWGMAEVGATVQLFADIDDNGLIDAGEPLLGETVAVRTNDFHDLSSGSWEITSVLDLNDLTIFMKRDGARVVLVRAIDATGVVNDPEVGERQQRRQQRLRITLYTPAPRVPDAIAPDDEVDALPDDAVDETPPQVSLGLPEVGGDGLRTDGSSGVETCPPASHSHHTNDTHPTFWGLAEVGAIVQLFVDDTDGDERLLGETVAIWTDDSHAYGSGFWEITSAVDLNDLTIFPQRDGLREVRLRAIDAAGNVNTLKGEAEIFLDTRPPRVPDVIAPVDEVVTSPNIGWTDGTQPQAMLSGDDFHTGVVIEGFVWHDLNGDGLQDDGEPGIEGVRVGLSDASARIAFGTDIWSVAVITGPDGRFSIGGAVAGQTVVIRFTDLPDGFAFTQLDAGDDGAIDSDVNAETGQIGPFIVPNFVDRLSVDAGLIEVISSLEFDELSASAFSSTQVDLTWLDTDVETGYRVFQWDHQLGRGVLIETLPADSTSHSVENLNADQLYFFSLEAFNEGGSSWSDWQQVRTPPAPPELSEPSVLVVDSSSQITVSWSPADAADGYRVYQWNGEKGALIASLPSDARSHVVTGLAAGGRHFFTVEAFNDGGSDFTAWNFASTPLVEVIPSSEPDDLIASAFSSTQVDLAWADRDTETGYHVFQWDHQLGRGVLIATLPADSTSHSVENLIAERQYFFSIEAFNDVGSSWSDWQQVGTPNNHPVMGLWSVIVDSSSQVTVGWSPVGDADGYRVYQRYGVQVVMIAALPGDATSHIVTGLSSDSEQTFMVEAFNDDASDFTSWFTVILPPAFP